MLQLSLPEIPGIAGKRIIPFPPKLDLAKTIDQHY
jgi:hypothetical protein